MAPGARKSCTSCQQQHIKCNSVHPTCGHCARGGRLCHWAGEFSFRHESNPSIQAGTGGRRKRFVDAQKWVDIPRELHFVDETREMQLTYTETWIRDPLAPQEKAGLHSPLTRTQIVDNGYEQDVSIPLRNYSPQNPSIGEGCNSPHPGESHACFGSYHHEIVLPNKILALEQQKGRRPGVMDEQVTRLLRYFIEKLSPWFDLCDMKKHFRNVAPRRALTSPTLLNAICAASARHMSRTTDFDPLVADHFCQACLSTLIPALHNPDLLKDEIIISAVVILRLFEELEGSHNLNHLLGIQVLLDAQDYTEANSGLGQAAFHVAMRQEIGMAFAHQRPVLAKLMEGNSSPSLSSTCESIWAYRSNVFLAVVLDFCYGSEGRCFEKWQELRNYHQQWVKLRPHVFEPIYVSDSADADFPTIRYLDDIHVFTANNYSLAQLLLVSHDPHSTRGKGRQSEVEEIEYHIRELCGTALSNVQVAVAMLSACAGISVFAHQSSNYETQVAFLDILAQTRKQHGWPTTVSREKLMDAWGWKE